MGPRNHRTRALVLGTALAALTIGSACSSGDAPAGGPGTTSGTTAILGDDGVPGPSTTAGPGNNSVEDQTTTPGSISEDRPQPG